MNTYGHLIMFFTILLVSLSSCKNDSFSLDEIKGDINKIYSVSEFERFYLIDSLLVNSSSWDKKLIFNVLKLKHSRGYSIEEKIEVLNKVLKDEEFNNTHVYVKYFVHDYLAVCYDKIGEFFNSFYHFNRAIFFLERDSRQYIVELGNLYQAIAYILAYYEISHEESLKYDIKSLRTFAKNSSLNLTHIYYNIASSLNHINEYRDSQKFCLKALQENNRKEFNSGLYSVINWMKLRNHAKLKEVDSVYAIYNRIIDTYEKGIINENEKNDFLINSVIAFVDLRDIKKGKEIIEELENYYSQQINNNYQMSIIIECKSLIARYYQDKEKEQKHLGELMELITHTKDLNEHYHPMRDRTVDRLIFLAKDNKDFQNLYYWFNIKESILNKKLKTNKSYFEYMQRLTFENKSYLNDQIITEKKSNRFKLVAILIVGILLFIIVLLFALILKRNKSLKSLNSKLNMQKVQIENNNKKLEQMNKEISSNLKEKLLHLSKKDKTLNQVASKFEKVGNDISPSNKKEILSLLKNNTDEMVIKNIDKQFFGIHEAFVNKLSKQYSELTSNNIKLCILIKSNLSTKEIAAIMSLTPDSVKTARTRLRKKLRISDANTKLVTFLNEI